MSLFLPIILLCLSIISFKTSIAMSERDFIPLQNSKREISFETCSDKEEWLKIKKLMDELDKPQPQFIFSEDEQEFTEMQLQLWMGFIKNIDKQKEIKEMREIEVQLRSIQNYRENNTESEV